MRTDRPSGMEGDSGRTALWVQGSGIQEGQVCVMGHAGGEEESLSDKAGRKGELRSAALKRRSMMDPARCARAGRDLADRLRCLMAPEDRGSARGGEGPTVALFCSLPGEISMQACLTSVFSRGGRVMVPKMGSGGQVGWGLMKSPEDLNDMHSPGGWRPKEPAGPTLGAQNLKSAGLILVPALAIDPCGYRLGRGGGWYDRALLHRGPNSLAVGICWEEEAVSCNLPREAHDLPVDAIATPSSFTLTAAGRARRTDVGS